MPAIWTSARTLHAGGNHNVAQLVDQILSVGALRPVLGNHHDKRGLAVRGWLRRQHGGHSGNVLHRGGQLIHDRRVATAEIGDEDQRAVCAGAEALGDHLVRVTGRGLLRVVARVREAEPGIEERVRQREQHPDAEHAGDDAVPVDQPALPNPAVGRLDVPTLLAFGVVVTASAFAVLIQRWQRASPPLRFAIAPVLWVRQQATLPSF